MTDQRDSPQTQPDDDELLAATVSLQTLWQAVGAAQPDLTLAASSADCGATLEPSRDLLQSRDEAALAGLPSFVIEDAGAGGVALAAAELRLGGTIGEGGMGIVRRAQQVALGREVAVKALRHDADRGEATLALLREAWVTGALEHPNVVPVHALGRAPEGTPVLVMKRILGKPWTALIHDPTLLPEDGRRDPLRWHLQALHAVCQAIAFAHSRRILHRDLKPDNVMIGAFGEVYVLDWGLAVALPGGDARLPQVNSIRGIAGTPHFMAPEMVEVRVAAIDERTDVYLLGAILHALLTGRPRHAGRTPMEVLAAAWRSDPIAYGPGVPEELATIANRATAKEPADRYPSATAFRDAIADFLAHRHSLELTRAARHELWRLRELLGAVADVDGVAGDTQEDARAGDPQFDVDASTVGADTATAADGAAAGCGPADEVLVGEAREAAIATAFSACRFGFQLALRGWAENPEARASLAEALDRMLGHHLARGDLGAARALAAEIGALEPAQQAQIDALAEAHRREAEAARANARAVADMDQRYGARTRAFMAILVAAIFGGQAFVFGALQRAHVYHWDYQMTWVVAGSFAALVFGLSRWARETLQATDFNRRVDRSLRFVSLASLALVGGTQGLGLPATTAITYQMLLFGTFNAMLGTALDPKIFVSGLPYFAAFAVAIAWPDAIFEAIGFGHALAVGLVAWLWRPRLVDGVYATDARALARDRAVER